MKSFLVSSLVLSVCLNVALLLLLSGCCSQPHGGSGGGEDFVSRQEMERLNKKIQDLARYLSIPEEQIKKESASELLSDIDSSLHDARMYAGRPLTEEELKIVSEILYTQTDIVKIIKEQNEIIQEIRSKKVFCLPGESE